MDQALKEKLTATEKWLRALFLIIFAFINYFVQVFSWAFALFQWVTTLFADKPNQRLVAFGRQLSLYSFQILAYLTYNSDKRPFPFQDWPKQHEKVFLDDKSSEK